MKGLFNRNSKLKFIVSFLLVLAMFMSPVSAVLNNIVWAIGTFDTSLVGHKVELYGFVNEVELNDEYLLPDLKIDNVVVDVETALVDNYVYKITMPQLGMELTYENEGIFKATTGDYVGKYVFKAEYKTVYMLNVEIKKDKEIKTVVSGMQINVVSPDYSLELPTNSKYVIPDTIPNNLTIKIPAPIVYEKDEVINVYDDSGKGQVVVSVFNSYSQTTGFDTTLKTDDKGDHYFEYVIPSTATGRQEIYYEYKNSEGSVMARTSQFFEAVSNRDFLSKLELEINWLSSTVVNAEVGKELTLPSANVINRKSGSTDSVKAYIKVDVVHVGGKTIDPDDLNGFKFTPRHLGSYRVTYTAKLDLFEGLAGFNNTQNVRNSKNFTIADVKDTTDPEILLVNPYTLDDDKNITHVGKFGTGDDHTAVGDDDDVFEMLGDLKKQIPSALIWSGSNINVKIPAIYAKDNYTTNFFSDKVTLTRSIAKPGSRYSDLFKKVGEETVVVPNNEEATIEISSTGTYTVRFFAKDEAGNDVYEYHTIVVKEAKDFENSNENLVKPIIELTSTLPSQASTNSKIVFSEPKVTDEFDKYPEITSVQYALTVEPKVGFYSNENITKNSDGKYVLDVADIINSLEEGDRDNLKAVQIIISAKNDYNPELTVYTHYINIYSHEDTLVPIVNFVNDDKDILTSYSDIIYATNSELISENGFTGTIDDFGYMVKTKEGDAEQKFWRAPFNQKDLITLPAIAVSDTDKQPLNVSVMVTNRYGKVVALDEKSTKTTLSSHEVLFAGGQFTAVDSGIYTVTYHISDIGGNIVVQTMGIRVNDNTAPIIRFTDESKFKTNHEVGEFFPVPYPNLEDNGEFIEVNSGIPGAGTVTWQIVAYPGNMPPVIKTDENGSRGFEPNHHGTYKIRYTASDYFDNDIEKEFELNVVDTTPPVIEFMLSSVKFPEVIKEWTTEDASDGKIIKIPAVYYTDANIDYDKVIKPVVKKGSSDPIDVSQDGPNWTFVAKTQGKYDVEYSISDRAGKKGTLTKQVRVGDCEPPKLTWVNDEVLIPATLKIKDGVAPEFVLPIDKFVVEDTVDPNPTYTVELRGPDGTEIKNEFGPNTDNNYKWKFEKAGKYSLRITLKDANLNTISLPTFYIDVQADEVKEDKVLTNTLGTILIVLSVVVLAGIVIYFVVSNRKVTPAKRKTSVKGKTKKD